MLHLDIFDVYGSAFAGLTASHARSLLLQSPNDSPSPTADEGSLFAPSTLSSTQQEYCNATEVGEFTSVSEQARRIIVDLAGPKIPYCDDALVYCLLDSGAHRYTEFKPIESSLLFEKSSAVYSSDRSCSAVGTEVPSTRQGIFRHPSLSLADKRLLTRFVSSVMQMVRFVGVKFSPVEQFALVSSS